jgi:hypothetical protein
VGRDGILFFSGRAVRRFEVQFAVPLLILARRRLRAARQIGEAVLCGDPEAVAAEKAPGGLVHESIMVEFGKAPRDRFLVTSDCLCCLATRAM